MPLWQLENYNMHGAFTVFAFCLPFMQVDYDFRGDICSPLRSCGLTSYPHQSDIGVLIWYITPMEDCCQLLVLAHGAESSFDASRLLPGMGAVLD